MLTEWLGEIEAAEFLRHDGARLAAAAPSAAAGVLTDTSISIGVRCELPPAVRRAIEERGWPILRRSSGGTALLHAPGDLLWSLVLPRDDARAGRSFARAYARLGREVVVALAENGVTAGWGPPIPLSDIFCLLGPRGETLRIDQRVLGGAAQHLTRAALLHHGAIHREALRPSIHELFGVPQDALSAHLGAVSEVAPAFEPERAGRRWLELCAAPAPDAPA